MSEIKSTCQDCYFFLAIDETKGNCKFNPPQVVGSTLSKNATVWPEVKNEEHCSRFAYDERLSEIQATQ